MGCKPCDRGLRRAGRWFIAVRDAPVGEGARAVTITASRIGRRVNKWNFFCHQPVDADPRRARGRLKAASGGLFIKSWGLDRRSCHVATGPPFDAAMCEWSNRAKPLSFHFLSVCQESGAAQLAPVKGAGSIVIAWRPACARRSCSRKRRHSSSRRAPWPGPSQPVPCENIADTPHLRDGRRCRAVKFACHRRGGSADGRGIARHSAARRCAPIGTPPFVCASDPR